jgi:hypothetical protein
MPQASLFWGERTATWSRESDAGVTAMTGKKMSCIFTGNTIVFVPVRKWRTAELERSYGITDERYVICMKSRPKSLTSMRPEMQ